MGCNANGKTATFEKLDEFIKRILEDIKGIKPHQHYSTNSFKTITLKRDLNWFPQHIQPALTNHSK